jgi:hypothetical protein
MHPGKGRALQTGTSAQIFSLTAEENAFAPTTALEIYGKIAF